MESNEQSFPTLNNPILFVGKTQNLRVGDSNYTGMLRELPGNLYAMSLGLSPIHITRDKNID